jgi:hypothetical protein
MEPKKVTAYQANDGTLHASLADAMVANNRGALRSLCNASSNLRAAIGDADDCPDEHEGVVSFLIANRAMIVKLLGGNEEEIERLAANWVPKLRLDAKEAECEGLSRAVATLTAQLLERTNEPPALKPPSFTFERD